MINNLNYSNYTKYNFQLNSPQLAYNINTKKYYLKIIKKNNYLSNNYNNNNYKTSYSRIYFPSKSITYP
jgi:hypothetical protein